MRWPLITEVLLVGLISLCVAARGGVAGGLLLPAAFISLGILLSAIPAAQSTGRTVRIPPLAWIPLAGAVMCLLQLVPLPAAMLRVLSPTLHDLGQFALRPLGLSTTRAISLDPPATAQEGVKHLVYFAVIVGAHCVGRDPAARRRLLLSIGWVAVALSVFGLVHLAMGWDALFGRLHFEEANPPLVTPFGNPNHLAGFLVLGAAIWMGMLWSPPDHSRRGLWALAYVTVGAALCLSLSRGGILAFGISQLLLIFLVLRAPRREETPWGWGPLFAVLSMGTVVALVAYLASDRLWAEFFPTTASSVSKVALWPEMARSAWDYPLGMGRGAFVFGFGHAQDHSGNIVFTHPENAVLQLASEFGWLPAIGLCAAASVLFLRALKARLPAQLEAAALCGVAGLVLQNLFDFSLEYFACALAACVMLGASAVPGLAVRERRPLRFLAASALLATLVAVFLSTQAAVDEARLGQQPTAARTAAQTLASGLPRIDRHPADPWLYLDVAAAYARDPAASPSEALVWVNRALWLRPADAEAHWVAAHALRRLGRPVQALEEYRRYFDRGGETVALWEEALRLAHGARQLQALIPPAQALRMVHFLAGNGRADEALGLMEAWGEDLDAFPQGAQLLAIESGLLRLKGRLQEAEQVIARAERIAPNAGEVVAQRAKLLCAQGRPETARGLLKSRMAANPEDVNVTLELAREQVEAGERATARRTVREALLHTTTPIERIELLRVEADAFERDGLPRRAVDSLDQAVRAAPELGWLHFELAQRLEEIQRYEDAAAQVKEGVLRAGNRGEPQVGWLERLATQARAKTLRRSSDALDLVSNGNASP